MKKYSVYEIIPYLKQGYVFIEIENRIIVCFKNEKIWLRHEQWHTKLKENDFMELYEDSTFIMHKQKDEEISKEKDDEYYAWRQRYL